MNLFGIYYFSERKNDMSINLDTLKKIMKERGYTYEHIANSLRCSKPFVWQIVNGERRLTYENALLIARVFGMKPDDLFYSTYLNNDDIKKRIALVDKYKNSI